MAPRCQETWGQRCQRRSRPFCGAVRCAGDGADLTLGDCWGTSAGNGEAGAPSQTPLVPCAPGPSRLSLLGGTSHSPNLQVSFFLGMKGARQANPKAGWRVTRAWRGDSQPSDNNTALLTKLWLWAAGCKKRRSEGSTWAASSTQMPPVPPSSRGRPRHRPEHTLGKVAAEASLGGPVPPILSSAPPPAPHRKPI